MRKWNASMPRERAPEGATNVVLSIRRANGDRMELECKMSSVDANVLMDQATQMMHSYKAEVNGNQSGDGALGGKGVA
jgi:hypothetical protein